MGQKLGQHFLASQSVLRCIADAVCPGAGGLVIEIGPGRGALTKHLLQRAARVVAIEIDEALVEHLRQKFAGASNFEVIHADVLKTDLHQWGPAAIAGNLPYYITSPIIERIVRGDQSESSAGASLAGNRSQGSGVEPLSPSWTHAVVLVQKEVADRLAAKPGSRDYGYLTVQTQLFADVKRLVRVPPSAFRPPPKVDSAAVLLTPRACPLTGDPPEFLKFASHCFRQKRKTLRNNLAPIYGKEILATLPEAARRAEQLSLDELKSLWLRIHGVPNPG